MGCLFLLSPFFFSGEVVSDASLLSLESFRHLGCFEVLSTFLRSDSQPRCRHVGVRASFLRIRRLVLLSFHHRFSIVFLLISALDATTDAHAWVQLRARQQDKKPPATPTETYLGWHFFCVSVDFFIKKTDATSRPHGHCQPCSRHPQHAQNQQRRLKLQQAAAKAAQENAKAKVNAIVADVKAAPKNLQEKATKAGEAAIGEVKR